MPSSHIFQLSWFHVPFHHLHTPTEACRWEKTKGQESYSSRAGEPSSSLSPCPGLESPCVLFLASPAIPTSLSPTPTRFSMGAVSCLASLFWSWGLRQQSSNSGRMRVTWWHGEGDKLTAWPPYSEWGSGLWIIQIGSIPLVCRRLPAE